MNDRELLEMAAKAAGYTLLDHFDIHGEWWPWCMELKRHWHPLMDDGDALRLGVHFGVFLRKDFIKTLSNLLGSGMDHREATRRAIVVTVVDIYRRLPPKSAGEYHD